MTDETVVIHPDEGAEDNNDLSPIGSSTNLNNNHNTQEDRIIMELDQLKSELKEIKLAMENSRDRQKGYAMISWGFPFAAFAMSLSAFLYGLLNNGKFDLFTPYTIVIVLCIGVCLYLLDSGFKTIKK